MSTRKPKPKGYKTALDVAKALGIDRTTLIRMHGRGDIPECKVWGAKPQPHRLYDDKEFAAVARAVEKNRRSKAPEGVVFVDSKVNNEQA